MNEARTTVWCLMRARRRQLTLARIARHWACYDLAAEHEVEAADLLRAAREAQRLARRNRRADWFAWTLATLALAGVVANYPLG